jgi:hypothetical protein
MFSKENLQPETSDSQNFQELKIRKRFFSHEQDNFPSLDQIEEKGNFDSGMKFKSGLSTVISNEEHEPLG